jgi:hypothetical protein
MKKNLDGWHEIAGLIDLEKRTALEGFHRLEFAPGARTMALTPPVPGLRRGWRFAFAALAASLLLAAGLASFWALKGSWGISPSAPAAGDLLSGSFLYGGVGSSGEATPAAGAPRAANPNLAAWIAAGLERAPAPVAPVDPKAPVERGDPEQVRRQMSRAIRENALEHMLTQFREIHNKEA